jgi:hypothetical protein
VLALPLALVILLRAAPSVDERKEDQPAHSWIVLSARVLNAALADRSVCIRACHRHRDRGCPVLGGRRRRTT